MACSHCGSLVVRQPHVLRMSAHHDEVAQVMHALEVDLRHSTGYVVSHVAWSAPCIHNHTSSVIESRCGIWNLESLCRTTIVYCVADTALCHCLSRSPGLGYDIRGVIVHHSSVFHPCCLRVLGILRVEYEILVLYYLIVPWLCIMVLLLSRTHTNM